MFEFNRSLVPVAGVGQLSFERAQGQICARDGDRKLVMSITTGPGFGQRLATAFADYRKATQEPHRQGGVSHRWIESSCAFDGRPLQADADARCAAQAEV
ncbi:hypothetical protein ASC95_08685 [Pelomonas sp. Root1217]|uniref:hypothetical protein n=1 Tax=Pelomonas sp. Root1217 TaxID=1736430 RepID=UPI000715B29B|nr:hypothetical protein [Pelomonas sp. Root1217]KQV52865.1 hypothetical protein ASC95_08685 [Pelomonas sp. Root1217]